MKRLSMFALILTFALPAVSPAAPARHVAAKKPIPHAAIAARNVPAARQPASDHPFSDVPPDHWAASAVETLRERGIVVGYPKIPPIIGG
jgi:hypothetical protein